MVPESVARAQIRPKAVDLFAGAGGFSLGLHQAGFHVVGAVEVDFDAAVTYMTNLARTGVQVHFDTRERFKKFDKYLAKQMGFNSKKRTISRALVAGSGWISHYPHEPGCEHFWIADARNLTGRQILDKLGLEPGELDCVCGGPPCQGFSIAGKRNVMDPRNSLVFEFARLICEMRPKTMIFENVPGILSMVTPAGLPVLDEFSRILEDGGFATVDAVKKSLGIKPNAKAVLRNNPEAKKAPPAPLFEAGEEAEGQEVASQ